MLKCDFHLHTASDKVDADITYTDEQLIDEAARQGFSVLSLTFHDRCHYPARVKAYAAKKGILLIPGIEKTIDNKHVLLINYPLKDKKRIEKIHTFALLRHYLKNLKTADREFLLTVFAHPRFWFIGMNRSVFRANLGICDALEYQSFKHTLYDFNEDVQRLARKYKKACIGTTDAHILEQFGHTYTLIDAKKDSSSVIHAIKHGKAHIVSRPLSTRVIVKRIRRDLLRNR